MVESLPSQVLIVVVAIINTAMVIQDLRRSPKSSASLIPVLLAMLFLIGFYVIQWVDAALCLDLLSPAGYMLWSLVLRFESTLAFMGMLLFRHTQNGDHLDSETLRKAILDGTHGRI